MIYATGCAFMFGFICLQFLRGQKVNNKKANRIMKKILLCCSAGMSTSMLVKKMEQAAASRGMECEIEALSVSVFEDAIQQFDVCLLGPQVRFQLEELKEIASRYGKPVDSIPPLAYGMMKGDEVLDQALSLIAE